MGRRNGGGLPPQSSGGGGSGITGLIGDVVATGSGVVSSTLQAIAGTALVIGTLASGNALVYNGTDWVNGPLSLNGGAGAVTGTLPVGNGGTGLAAVGGAGTYLRSTGSANAYSALLQADLPTIALTGDATGSAAAGSIATTVAKVNGATVPAAGALTTGNVLQVTGASALGYAPVNLAGGANYVTGVLPAANMAAVNLAGGSSSVTGQLPVANLANGTAGQMLVTNSGATAPAWVTVSGDSTLAASGAVVNTAMRSGEYTWGTSGTVTWATAADTPLMTQTALASTSAGSGSAGQSFTITAQAGQAATGASHNGGAGGLLILGGGAGGTSGSATAGAAAGVQFQAGGMAVGQLQGTTTDFIALGGTPGGTGVAATGYIRVLNSAVVIAQRNSGGTADISVLTVTGNDTVNVGPSTAGLFVNGSACGSVGLPLRISNTTSASANSNGPECWGSSGTLMCVGGGGAITTIAPTGSGTANTQALTRPSQMGVGRVTSSGGTVTLSVPLATSSTCGVFSFTGVIRAVSGTGVTAGDTYAITYRATFKNVGGTVTQVGLTATVMAATSDTSLASSTLAFSISGTNIVATLTATATTGTLTAADCTIDVVEAIIN